MDTITHALAPIVFTRLVFGRPAWVGKWGFWIIGISGALPDLINPHLSLEARMSSWSHGIAFWGFFTAVVLGTSMVKKAKLAPAMAVAMSLSYIFHILCDGISGGVDFLRPFGSYVWGDYYVDPKFWVPLDIVLLITVYILFRVVPAENKPLD